LPESDVISERKRDLRRRVLAARDALPASVRADLSRRIAVHLRALPALVRAQAVLAYLPFGSELDIADWLREIVRTGRLLALPRVDRLRRELGVHRVGDLERDVVAGPLGIREPNPASCSRVPLQRIDAIVAPGVAFTATGLRLGYGGGYYDRLLGGWPAPRPTVIAAAFSIQVVPEVPAGPNDVAVDIVVTEIGVAEGPADR
jgi:5-formyltetrahydrofolate cyclo-ligase